VGWGKYNNTYHPAYVAETEEEKHTTWMGMFCKKGKRGASYQIKEKNGLPTFTGGRNWSSGSEEGQPTKKLRRPLASLVVGKRGFL